MTVEKKLGMKEETIIEPVIPEEEEEDEKENSQLRLCSNCWKRLADKKVTSYGTHPDGIPRISKYCDYCIETEYPQFKSSLA